MEDFFSSTEFYVGAIAFGVLLFIFFLSPSGKGEVYTYFFEGYKYPSPLPRKEETPQLFIEGTEDGSVKLMHTDVELSPDAIISLVVNVNGNDIKITEKIEDKQDLPIEYNDVAYFITCLKSQRYHLYFESAHTGMWASTSLINNPDFQTKITLRF